jgi:teichuronic acid biosynthesis glycosyltransferase TuaG
VQKKPLISIIIPYHRKKKYFSSTINSISLQTFKNYEVILIYDDIRINELGFVKNTLKKIRNKKILKNKKILGPGLSRNKGILNSSGQYLAFCDADDIWNKNKLKIQLNFMEKNKLSFSHSNYYIIDYKNKKVGKFIIKKIIDFNDLMKSCDIGLSSVMLHRKLISKKRIFCNLKTKEDYFLWLKIIKEIKFIRGINKFLVSWRYSKGSLSDSLLQKINDSFRLYNRHEKYSKIISFLFVIRLSFNALIKKIKIYN